MIHVSTEQLARMKSVVNTIKENGDAFLTLPGMNSYYLWTGMSPPTDANVTNWMLLSNQQQRENFAALQASRRPCVFFDIETARFWNKAIRNAQQAPLVTLVDSHYRLGVAQATWLLLVPNDRTEATLVDATGNKTRIVLPPLQTSRKSDVLPVDP